MSVTLFFQCGSFDVWRKLRELRSATLGMESRKANISSFVLRGGSEVMFREPQNSSLHHEGGEILLPMVAESECTNCKQYIEWQTYRNKTILCGNATLRQRILPFCFYQYFICLCVLMSHSRCIYSLYVLFLVATKLIDNCKSDRCPVIVYLHSVVLVALYGTCVV